MPTLRLKVLIHLLSNFFQRWSIIVMQSRLPDNLLVSCCRTAPRAALLASQMILIGWFLLKCCISVTACIAFSLSSNARSWFSVQFHSFPLPKGRSGAHSCAKFGMKISLKFFGFILSVIA